MQLLLDTKGLLLKRRNDSFVVEHREMNVRHTFSPFKITSIAITTQCFLSSGAIELAARSAIPILFFDATGNASARLWSASFGKLATLRRQQVLSAETPKAPQYVGKWLELKNEHQAHLLTLLANRFPSKATALLQTKELIVKDFESIAIIQSLDELRPSLLGQEGSRAKAYWQALASVMQGVWAFENRSQHPAQDAFNACLNYLYGMLYRVVEGGIFAAGLDPYLGYFHVDAYNEPTLTYDMIEPFRPWVDELLVFLCINNQLSPETVIQQEDHSFWITKEGKQKLIPAFNDWMKYDKIRFGGKDQNRKDQIYRFIGEFADSLGGEF